MEQSLKVWQSDNLVKRFEYNMSDDLGFCESHIGGKQHQIQLKVMKGRQEIQVCLS